MDIIKSTQRLVLQKSLAGIYEHGMMLMRKDPEGTKKQFSAAGKSTEGLDDIFSLPDFMIKRIAECTAEVITEDPKMVQILKGQAEIESARLTEKLALKDDVVSWFEKTRSDEPAMQISDEQIKRDGALLLCRKAAAQFERGMFSQAEIFYSRAVEIDENHADGWSGLADSLRALGEIERSDTALARADLLRSEGHNNSL